MSIRRLKVLVVMAVAAGSAVAMGQVGGQEPATVGQIVATRPSSPAVQRAATATRLAVPTTQRAVTTRLTSQPVVATRPAGIQPGATQPASLRVDGARFDFGTVWDTDALTHTFEMVNGGSRTVTITGVHPSCGCTTTDAWAKVVEPGKTWQLQVKFNPAGRRGKSSKSITVDTDDPGAKQVVFLLDGEIKPRFDMASNVNFGTLRQDSLAKRTITISNNSDEPVQLKDVKVDVDVLKVGLREIEAGRKYELDVETVPPLKMQSLRGKITMATDMKDKSEVVLYAFAYVQPRISLMPQVVMVQQPLDREFRRRLVLKATEGVTVHVAETKVSNPKIDVRVEPVREGQEYSIWLTMPEGMSLAPAGETVTITTDDEEMPTLAATVRSFISPQSRKPAAGAMAPQTQPSMRVLDRLPTSRPAVDGSRWPAPMSRPMIERSRAPMSRPGPQAAAAPASQP